MEFANQHLNAVTVLIRAADAVYDAIKQEAAGQDLNVTEFSVLELLYHQGRQPIQAIGKKVLIASSSITYVVDKLERKGYVEREACTEDRRVTYGLLTTDGENLMAGIFPGYEQKIGSLFDGLSEQEVKNLIDTLKKIGCGSRDGQPSGCASETKEQYA